MSERFERQSLIIGEDATKKLGNKKVALFGVGGVGSYAAEALARCGVGTVELIDSDCVSLSNINRQLCALQSTVGMPKVDVTASRMKDINPHITVIPRKEFFLPQNADSFDFSSYDFVIDAIDTVSAKVEIALRCSNLNVPMISCMGTGNKLDPTAFKITDIYKTDTCPLCRVMRKELKTRGVKKLKVLYSTETPQNDGERTPASISFVPSVAGLIIAGEVIKDIMNS